MLLLCMIFLMSTRPEYVVLAHMAQPWKCLEVVTDGKNSHLEISTQQSQLGLVPKVNFLSATLRMQTDTLFETPPLIMALSWPAGRTSHIDPSQRRYNGQGCQM